MSWFSQVRGKWKQRWWIGLPVVVMTVVLCRYPLAERWRSFSSDRAEVRSSTVPLSRVQPETIYPSSPPSPMPSLSISLTKIAENTTDYGSHLAFSADGHLLAVVNPAGALYLWQDLTPWQTRSRPGEWLDRPFFTTGDRLLVAPQIFEIKTQQWLPLPPLVSVFTADLAEGEPTGGFAVYASAWSSDSNDLVVYGEHRPSRRLGDRSTWAGPTKRLLLLEGQTRQLKAVLWQGQGSEAYRTIALHDQFIAAAAVRLRVWDRQTQKPVADLGEHTLVIHALQWSADGSLLASGGADQQVILWNTRTWEVQRRWQAHLGEVKALAFHPHNLLLVTGGEDQQIKFWSLEGKLLKTELVQGMVEGLAFNPQGDRLAVAQGGTDASIQVYQVQVQ